MCTWILSLALEALVVIEYYHAYVESAIIIDTTYRYLNVKFSLNNRNKILFAVKGGYNRGF